MLPTISTENIAQNDVSTNIQSTVSSSIEAIISPHCSKNLEVTQDFNIKNKHRGFLNHGPAKFSFIGPDNIARIIRSTGKPNYTEARIPIASGLNISAWEKALDGYPDQMLIQYLKFGFPLSIINPDTHTIYSILIYKTIILQCNFLLKLRNTYTLKVC